MRKFYPSSVVLEAQCRVQWGVQILRLRWHIAIHWVPLRIKVECLCLRIIVEIKWTYVQTQYTGCLQRSKWKPNKSSPFEVGHGHWPIAIHTGPHILGGNVPSSVRSPSLQVSSNFYHFVWRDEASGAGRLDGQARLVGGEVCTGFAGMSRVATSLQGMFEQDATSVKTLTQERTAFYVSSHKQRFS